MTGGGKEIGAFSRRNRGQELADLGPKSFDGSFGCLAQQCLELGECLLDRVEVRTVRRQEKQFGGSRFYGGANVLAFVVAEVGRRRPSRSPRAENRFRFPMRGWKLASGRAIMPGERIQRADSASGFGVNAGQKTYINAGMLDGDQFSPPSVRCRRLTYRDAEAVESSSLTLHAILQCTKSAWQPALLPAGRPASQAVTRCPNKRTYTPPSSWPGATCGSTSVFV
jgi:hypothetical protein